MLLSAAVTATADSDKEEEEEGEGVDGEQDGEEGLRRKRRGKLTASQRHRERGCHQFIHRMDSDG